MAPMTYREVCEAINLGTCALLTKIECVTYYTYVNGEIGTILGVHHGLRLIYENYKADINDIYFGSSHALVVMENGLISRAGMRKLYLTRRNEND